jgi:hypothetical protein
MSEGIDLAPDKDASPQEVQGANKWLTGTEVGDRRAADVNIVGSITLNTSGGGGGGGGDVNIDEYGGVATTLGQKTMSASIPVTIASDQSAVEVKGDIADGAAASGTNPVLVAGSNPSGNIKPLSTAPDGDLITHMHTDDLTFPDGVSNTERAPVNETDLGFMTFPTFPYNYNGTTWDRVRGDATNGLLVNLGANNDVRGAVAEGAAASGANPVTIAGKDVFGNVAIPTLLQAAGVFNLTAVINADTDGTTQDYRSTGEAYALVGSTDGTKANANFLLFDSSRRANIAGQVAHNAANTGNPVVGGSEAIADPLSVSAVAAGDATKHYADLVGRQYNVNFAFHRDITTELNALETTFNAVTLTANSSDIKSNGFRKCQLGFTAAFANTPTAIFIYVQTKFPSGTYRTREDGYLGQWSYTRAIITSKPEICCEFDINCDTFRIQIEATGTTASNTFTLTNVEAVLTT